LIATTPLVSDARGNAWTPLAIPANATLRGFAFALHSLSGRERNVRDPVSRFATSNGLRLQLY